MPRRAQGGRRPCAPRALLYSAAAWLWLCCASMWGTCVLIEAAQRFVLEDEGIREIILPPSSTPPNGGRGGKVPLPSQIKASVNAKQNKLRGLDEQAPAAAVSTARDDNDVHFYNAWFKDDATGYKYQRENASAFGAWPSPTALAVLMKKSIFCLSLTGRVFERFHNQVKWVYVRHENPSSKPLVALTAVRNRGTYFASDADGRVFQRLRVENGLGWMDVTNEDNFVFLAGVPSSEGNVFFITAQGELLERQFDQGRSNVGGMWSNHGKPDDSELVAVVDAHTLSYGSVFAIGANGQLYELNLVTSWQDHGPPLNSRLAPLPGVALKDLNAVGSIFLRTESGDLVERWWDAHLRTWHWINHEHPKGARVVSAPGALINGLSIFMTTTGGNMYERFWDAEKWIWVDHGNPGVAILPVSPVDVHDGSIFCYLENGKLAERMWWVDRNRWTWRTYEVPEGGSASYCSADPLSRNNCVQGYGSPL